MPRGRHRHSPPLHKLLPPLVVGCVAVCCAAGAWLASDPVVLRVLVAGAAVVAVIGAAFMRSWDRDAGHRVAHLTRGRENDRWQAEEQTAELEADVEESREIRVRLEAKLRSKRVELAALRSEHAALLRRYARAETERASALEGRRQLAIEAAAEPKALPRAGSTPSETAYVRAARALDALTRSAALQQAEQSAERDEPQGKQAAADGKGAVVLAEPDGLPDVTSEQQSRRTDALPSRRIPAAAEIVPYTPKRRPAQGQSGFDFFGTQSARPASGTASASGTVSDRGGSGRTAGREDAESSAEPDPANRPPLVPAPGQPNQPNQPNQSNQSTQSDQPDRPAVLPPPDMSSVAQEDLADVVGGETVATGRGAEDRVAGQGVDLNEQSGAEQLAMGKLRSTIGL